jgi:CRISPR system Cascade subunit CasE
MTETFHPYELHRSLMRAFPDERSGGSSRVLFRLDINRQKGDISVLVQSEKEPDWAALNNAGDFLLEPPQQKPYDPIVAAGQVLYFRLRANPTIKRDGKRLSILKEEEQVNWLKRKGEKGGFEVVSLTIIPEGIAHDKMTDGDNSKHKLSLLSVRFEGLLKVTDSHIFRQTLERGTGSAKGLGFGLLSIAPLKEG